MCTLILVHTNSYNDSDAIQINFTSLSNKIVKYWTTVKFVYVLQQGNVSKTKDIPAPTFPQITNPTTMKVYILMRKTHRRQLCQILCTDQVVKHIKNLSLITRCFDDPRIEFPEILFYGWKSSAQVSDVVKNRSQTCAHIIASHLLFQWNC